ncbi:hypothetical protein J4Q44_G00378780 [Coregonus suidteri]|uniref:Uncharacterized protein n=1 Tax=Coregonus suidteri TaxID=861788 RepID=A0AAN8KJZ3_9TELE
MVQEKISKQPRCFPCMEHGLRRHLCIDSCCGKQRGAHAQRELLVGKRGRRSCEVISRCPIKVKQSLP